MKRDQQIHFLVVEDEIEIADIICLFLGGYFCASFTVVKSGDQAVEVLQAEGSLFQMVISDFNMAQGDGKVVFDYVRQHFPQTPFMLVTSDSWSEHPEFHNIPNVGYVPKPFVDDTLVSEVERLMKICELKTNREHQHVGISLQTLSNIKTVAYPLFVKLGEYKYVRFVNQGTEITAGDLVKYRQKGISYLYVERADFNGFISKFRQKVLNDMVFRGISFKTQDALELSSAVQEIMQGAARTFGLSAETQELATRNLELVKGLSEKITELDSIFQWASFSEMEYTFIHSVLICYLTTEVVSHLKIDTPYASEILALAACFHDMALENHQVKNEQRFIRAIALHSSINREDLLSVREHSEVASQMVKNWTTCPPEVVTIIKEHHERPDGSGFPSEKRGDQIHELSACFIVCEDLVQNYLELKDKASVEKYFIERAKFYSPVPFQPIYNYLTQKLLGPTKSTATAAS